MISNHDQSDQAMIADPDPDQIIEQLKLEIQHLTTARDQDAQAHQQQLYAAELTIAAREKELDQLYKHVHQLTAENDAHARSAQERGALNETRRELDSAQKYAASVSSSLHHSQQKLKAAEAMLAQLRAQLDSANNHMKTLTGENQRFRGQLLSADDAILQLRSQLDSARADNARLADELGLVRSSKAAGLAPLQNKLQEAEAHIAKLDAELVGVDRARFEFESECVRLRESLRFNGGGLGAQLSREVERRQAAQHDLVKLDKYCRYLREQIAAMQTGKALPPHLMTPPPPHPYGPSAQAATTPTGEIPALDRLR